VAAAIAMKTIIAGSRFDWYDEALRARWRKVLYAAADEFYLAYGITKVFSGTASGCDRLGEEWAQKNCIGVKYFPAAWENGRQAAARNAEMAKEADALIAVWDGVSPGTRLMIDMAHKRGLTVCLRIFG
jgi:hypothetical protein